MTTDERWTAAGERRRGAFVVVGDHDAGDDEPFDHDDEPYDQLRAPLADAPASSPGRSRWGVAPRAALALVVVALLVAAGLVVRAVVLEPDGAAVAAMDPAVAAVPGAEAVPGTAGADAQPPVSDDPSSGAAPEPLPGSGSGSGSGSVEPAAAGAVAVHVVGAVVAPGVVEVPAGSRVADAVAAAGGLSPEADPAGVNLARSLGDGEQVVVPRPGEVVTPPAGAPPGTGASTGAGGAAAGAGGAPDQLVDVNSAGVAELDALPGIGPVLAQRVVDFRETNGPFTSVDELVEVPGIGDAILASLTPLVRV